MKDEERALMRLSKERMLDEIAQLTELAVETEQVEAIPALSALLEKVNSITCENTVEHYRIQQLSFQIIRLAVMIRDTARQTGG
jgi:hypothetical protein